MSCLPWCRKSFQGFGNRFAGPDLLPQGFPRFWLDRQDVRLDARALLACLGGLRLRAPGLFLAAPSLSSFAASLTSAALALGKKDPGAVVWDEIVTVPMVFLFLEPRLVYRPEILVLGFALHRLFDISKPWPVHTVEKLPAGTGIMCDDVVAAVYAWCALRLVIWAVPWFAR